jgi:hypothetical protein
MPWIKGGLLPSTLAPAEWAGARGKCPLPIFFTSSPGLGYEEEGHGSGGGHKSSTTLFARSLRYEPADREERPSPQLLWDRSSSVDSLRPQTSLGDHRLPRSSPCLAPRAGSCVRPRGHANQSHCLPAHPRRVRLRAACVLLP